MAEVLIAALSPVGHIGPLLHVARGLVDRGDRVTVLSGARHADDISALGATPAALPPQGDLDLALLDSDSGREHISGIKRLNFDIVRLFVAPMPYQTRALADLMAQKRFDAILADYGFFGVLPFLLGDRAARPPILAYSTAPLMFSSRDTAPSGLGLPPSTTALGRLRNRALSRLSQTVLLRRSQKAANHQLHRLNSRRLPMFLLDSGVLADRFIVPTVPEFDYPRSDLPPTSAMSGWCIRTRRRTSAHRCGGRSSTVTAPSCTSPRAPSTTPTSAGCCGRPSRRWRTRTSWWWPPRADRTSQR